MTFSAALICAQKLTCTLYGAAAGVAVTAFVLAIAWPAVRPPVFMGLQVLSFITCIAGLVLLLAAAFQESIRCGLLFLLIAPYAIYFTFSRFSEQRGRVLLLVSSWILGAMALGLDAVDGRIGERFEVIAANDRSAAVTDDAAAELQASVTWSAQPDPPSTTFTLPDEPPAALGAISDLLVPSTPAPFVADLTRWKACRVVNLSTGDVAGSVSSPELDLLRAEHMALSPDGQQLAVVPDHSAGIAAQAELWQVSDSTRTCHWPLAEGAANRAEVKFLDFAGPGELVAVEQTSQGSAIHRKLVVYDATNGTRRHVVELPSASGVYAQALSANRRYLAIDNGSRNGVGVYDLLEGVQAGVVRYREINDWGLGPSAMAFSPDGTQLAMLRGIDADWFVYVTNMHNGQTRVAARIDGGSGNSLTPGPRHRASPLLWLPDARGWIVNGRTVVDAARGEPVWHAAVARNSSHCIPVADGLWFANSSSQSAALRHVVLPWDRVQQLQQQVDTAENRLRNGQGVTLQVDVTAVRFGTVAATRDELTGILTKYLTGRGLHVVEGQELVLRLGYSEAAGESLKFHGFGENPFTSPGHSVESTVCRYELRLQSADGGRVDWEQTGVGELPSFLRVDVSAEAVRKESFNHVCSQIRGAMLPVLLTQQADEQLPLVYQTGNGATTRQARDTASQPGTTMSGANDDRAKELFELPGDVPRPITDLTGWTKVVMAQERLEFLAPPATDVAAVPVEAQIASVKSEMYGCHGKDPRGVVVRAEFAIVPRGVPDAAREQLLNGSYEAVLQANLNMNPRAAAYNMRVTGDTRGQRLGFPSRTIQLTATADVKSEIHWIVGDDWILFFVLGYRGERPGVLEDVLNSLQIHKRPVDRLDSVRFKTPTQRGLDLLAEIDPRQHAAYGNWSKDADGLVVSGEFHTSLLALPTQIPENYRLTFDVERLSGNGPLHVGIRYGDQPVAVVIDENPVNLTGLSLVGGKPALQPPNPPSRSQIQAKQATIRLVVSKGVVSLFANDRKQFQWTGPAELAVDKELWTPPANMLFLGAQNAAFRFTRLEIEAL